jgi:predicted nucleotide-binding protein
MKRAREIESVLVESNDARWRRLVMPDSRRVFVVYGRNELARRAMFSFLRSIGLDPIEWTQAITASGGGTPYIGEIISRALETAQSVVVLLTGDDLAYLVKPFRKPDDPPLERELTPQARPNVLFEAGLALGLFPERTILVQLGPLRPLSDLAGRHLVVMDNSVGRRSELAQRLRNAQCAVDIESKLDWQYEGDFDAAIEASILASKARTRPLPLWKVLPIVCVVAIVIAVFFGLRTYSRVTYMLPADFGNGLFTAVQGTTDLADAGYRPSPFDNLPYSGTAYQVGNSTYPWVLLAHDRKILLLHPDPSSEQRVSIAFTAPARGAYHIRAIFARANTAHNGNGVEVALLHNDWRLAQGRINPDEIVNPDNLFPEQGPVQDLVTTVVLAEGDRIHFAVASKPAPLGTFAATALKATIDAELQRW